MCTVRDETNSCPKLGQVCWSHPQTPIVTWKWLQRAYLHAAAEQQKCLHRRPYPPEVGWANFWQCSTPELFLDQWKRAHWLTAGHTQIIWKLQLWKDVFQRSVLSFVSVYIRKKRGCLWGPGSSAFHFVSCVNADMCESVCLLFCAEIMCRIEFILKRHLVLLIFSLLHLFIHLINDYCVYFTDIMNCHPK